VVPEDLLAELHKFLVLNPLAGSPKRQRKSVSVSLTEEDEVALAIARSMDPQQAEVLGCLLRGALFALLHRDIP